MFFFQPYNKKIFGEKMFYLIFFFFFLVALISLWIGATQKLTPFYVVGMGFIAVSGVLLAGSGIDFPIDTTIEYTAGDPTSTTAVLRNFSADQASNNFDEGVFYLHLIFLYGGLVGVIGSLFFTVQWVFDWQRKYRQKQLESKLLDSRLRGIEKQEAIQAARGIR